MAKISCPKCGKSVMIRMTSAFGRVIVEKSELDKVDKLGVFPMLHREDTDVIHLCNPEDINQKRREEGRAPIRHRVYPYKGARKDGLKRHKANEKRRIAKREREFEMGMR